MKVGINDFVRRQTAESRFSHFSGTWEQLIAIVESAPADKITPGYREGVVLVEVAPEGFFAGVVKLEEGTKLSATFARRRPEEDPFVEWTAQGDKLPAKFVQVVLYSHDVLMEGKENSTDLPWEIISINARATEGPEPLSLSAMVRNQWMLTGGTAAEYSSNQWCEAVKYWLTHANVSG